jgi:hypothetical protein
MPWDIYLFSNVVSVKFPRIAFATSLEIKIKSYDELFAFLMYDGYEENKIFYKYEIY